MIRARLASLDIFRGGTVAAMILVNNQIGRAPFSQLEHAEWHGLTLADLVFPCFLWIVGVAITLSRPSTARAIRRGLLIIALGVLLNLAADFSIEHLRIPGVLQRIGVCYLAASLVYIFFGTVGRILWTCLLLGSYWFLMTAIPVPGCGAGSFSMDCNFARRIDAIVLGGHMWSHSRVWDPEGLVSTLPAIGTVMFGIFAGQVLALMRSAAERTVWLFVQGTLLILAGLILLPWMPLNKSLWTVPYALLTSGIAAVIFAKCFWFADQRGWVGCDTPFAMLGVNALAMFLVSGMFAELLTPLTEGLLRNASPWASLAYSIAHVLACFLVAWALYRKGWVLKI